MTALELLAPARNLSIGIAAIDCGADAVYIAGPAYGARKDAANSMADISELCRYAHKFGARVFVTVNTIVYDEELDDCCRLLHEIHDAGADAVIAQDMAIMELIRGVFPGFPPMPDLPVHASTQCAIRTPERARELEEVGFSRLVLERQLSLDQIQKIRESVSGEIEVFVHGALCVSYSGECYLSEKIAGRSANRGACIQACRARYDLSDGNGNLLAKDQPILSLKDYNLIGRLADLAEAGACSFKIEGRLKNISYVRNVVTAYSRALDKLIACAPEKYCRASAGRSITTIKPHLEKTFNRGYTELFLDGKRGQWAGLEAPKGMGERLGRVIAVSRADSGRIKVTVDTTENLSNGDGFAFISKNSICGVRGDVCKANTFICKPTKGLTAGVVLFRNLDSSFEKVLAAAPSRRIIDVSVSLEISQTSVREFRIALTATSSDGRRVETESTVTSDTAEDRRRMEEIFIGQLSKSSGHYNFSAHIASGNSPLPVVPASGINAMRRQLADELDSLPCRKIPLRNITGNPRGKGFLTTFGSDIYKSNIANRISASLYNTPVSAYEINHPDGVELLRSRYCIRHELGICPRQRQFKGKAESLYLTGNGSPLELRFDCKSCEMAIIG